MPGILTVPPTPVSSGYISSSHGPTVKGPLGVDQRDKQGQKLQNQLPTVTKNCESCVGWGVWDGVCGMGCVYVAPSAVPRVRWKKLASRVSPTSLAPIDFTGTGTTAINLLVRRPRLRGGMISVISPTRFNHDSRPR